jgi:hypothetical protein
MSVEQLKIDAIDAAQKYKARYKQSLDPNDLDMFKRFMDVYNHLDGVGGGGVSSIIAGTNITVSPSGGTGDVTISATTALVPDPTGYGSFYSNVSQPITNINTPQAVTLGQTYEAVGTSTSGSRIYMDKAGTYQFSYVAQVASSANSQEYAEFWIKYNGVEYPNSNTKLILQPRKSSTEPSEQLMTLIINGTSLNDNDYIELFWEATSTEVSLKYDPANASYPATPSIIANIIPIGAQGRDSNLNELNDVLITTPSTGQLLRIDSDGLWKNWTPNFLTTVPTLDQVTTAGNTTTNAITVGGLTVATNLIYTDTVNNRVGIATTTLGSRLGVKSSGINTNVFAVFNSADSIIFRVFNGGSGQALVDIGDNIRFRSDSALSYHRAGNFAIGTTTDAGYKLDVNGTGRFQGSANTIPLTVSGYSVTGTNTTKAIDLTGTWNTSGNVTALSIDITNTASGINSNLINASINGSTNIFSVRRDGTVIAQSTFAFHASSGNISGASSLALSTSFSQQTGIIAQRSQPIIATTGNFFTLSVDSFAANASTNTFIPTSGTATYTAFRVVPTINQTGGANGITRGIYVNPTLTAAADWRSIETVTGNVIFGSTSGNVLVGTTTDAGYKLDVNGTARVQGNSFEVTNGATSKIAITSAQILCLTGVTVGNLNVVASAISMPYSILGIGTTVSGGTTSNLVIGSGNATNSSGTITIGQSSRGFAPTSGTATFSFLTWNGTINQTGGANGITRGLYINPTITSAADFRAIETTTGKIIHQGLTNATQTDQVYYNSATGELTYGAAAGGSTPTLDQVTTAGNTTTNAITVDKLTINNGTYNASIGFGLINNPTANYFDVFFANNTGLRFGSPSFDGSAFQAFGGLHASYPGQLYFDYGSQQRTVANRSANFRNASSPSPVTVMKLTDTSNVLIGTTIDNGERLQVSGQVSADAYIAAGQQGLTIDIPTGAGQTLHFEGGILTNVF